MKEVKRDVVLAKYGGRCAYCGQTIDIKTMQIDEIEPVRRYIAGWRKRQLAARSDINKINPACRRCNRWKATFSLAEFSNEIRAQVYRLRRNSAAYRLAEDYGMVRAINRGSVFYYEEADKVKKEEDHG